MTDMDVSLRLRLVNQLSRPAEEAERDLKALQKTAEQLGRAKGGDGLARGLADVGQKAETAKSKINAVEKEADQLRKAIGRTGSGFDSFKADAGKADAALVRIKDKADHTRLAIARIGDGFGNFKADAASAEAALKGIDQQAAVTKAAIGRIDDNAFSGLKSDAAIAEAAIRQIGAAADATDARLKGLRAPITGGNVPGAPNRAGAAHVPAGGLMSTVEGAVDQFGAPVALAAGGAYLAGAVPAAAVVAGGAAINAAGKDEFVMDQLQVTGGFDDAEQERIRQMLGQAGARRGIGSQGAMGVFGALQAGGLSSADAATMTDDVIVFAKATQAEPEDAANTAIALRNNMGIPADQMMKAYDAMAVGGKEGQFEVKDMSRQFPSMLAAMAAQGSKGFEGVNLATAMAQSIRKTTGSGDQAKTRFEAMLSDLTAPEVADRARKLGFNPDTAKQKALAKGEDPVLAMIEGYRKVVGNNEPRFKELFRNSESYAALAAVFKDIDEMKAMVGRMQNADGTVGKDYETATSNFDSQKDRLSSNVALRIKDAFSPFLPYLTKAAEWASTVLEPLSEQQKAQQKAYQDRFEAFYGGLNADPNDPANGRRWLEMVNAVPGSAPERSHGGLSPTERDEQNQAIPGWKKLLFGKAAEPDFSLRQTLGVDLRGSAEQAMGGYNEALAAEGEKAKAEAQQIADHLKATLNFTVSPTIAPTFVSPAGAPSGGAPAAGVPGKQSSLQTNTGVKLTQHISSPNSRLAALRAQREANRSVRMAQSRALGDLGPRIA